MNSGGFEGSQMSRLGIGRIQKSCVPPMASSGATASDEANFSAAGASSAEVGVVVGTSVAVGERGGALGSDIASWTEARRGAGKEGGYGTVVGMRRSW